MKDPTTYPGWGDTSWTIDANNDYPRLAWEGFPHPYIIDTHGTYSGGTGDPADPFLIATLDDLLDIAHYPGDAHLNFRLTDDLDLDTLTFDQPLIPLLFATFDGAGHIIRNLTLEGSDNLALFGMVAATGQIQQLGIHNAIIDATGSQAAMLCTHNAGTIRQCYAAGYVYGMGELAGLVAYNTGQISDCYTEGELFVPGWYAPANIGGICASNTGLIQRSYSSTVIDLGYAYSWAVDAFAPYADDAAVEHCFVNADVCILWTAYAEKLTANQMADPANFLDAGWDFIGESANGTDDIWIILPGDYPSLAWQTAALELVPDVIGLNYTTAHAILIDNGFPIDSVAYAYSNDVPAGLIIAQTPLPASDTVADRAVSMIFSLGQSPYTAGTGTPADPIQIASTADLILMAYKTTDYHKHFILTADIDLTGAGDNLDGSFSSAIIAASDPMFMTVYPFTGDFDGNGHTISNLKMRPDSVTMMGSVGLFGAVAYGGQLRNINLTDSNLIIDDNYAFSGYGIIGPLVGSLGPVDYMYGYLNMTVGGGTISNCHVIGQIQNNTKDEVMVSSCGGMVGIATGQSLIENCTADVDFSLGVFWSMEGVGGLVGNHHNSTMTNCHASANISSSGATYAGLGILAGMNGENGTIHQCSAQGQLTILPSDDYAMMVGGLLGYNRNIVSQCAANVDINCLTSSSSVGGLCGYNEENIFDSYALGAITCVAASADAIGGFVGSAMGDIQRSYASVLIDVSAGSSYSIDAFAGNADEETVQNCFFNADASTHSSAYATQLDSAQMTDQASFLDAGWDFIDETANGTDDIWQILPADFPSLAWQAPAAELVPDIVGLDYDTASAILIANGFLPGAVTYAYGPEGSEDQVVEQTPLPGAQTIAQRAVAMVLSMGPSPYTAGSGTLADPIQIASVADLLLLAERTIDYHRYFIVTADINLTAAGDNPDGSFSNAIIAPTLDPEYPGTPFTGNFNGNGHTLSHLSLHCTSPDGSDMPNIGLFGNLAYGGQVRNLTLTDFNLLLQDSGSDAYFYHVGSFVGMLGPASDDTHETGGATLSNCHVSGHIHTAATDRVDLSYCGGLVGKSTGQSRIENCSAQVDIALDSRSDCWRLGGLIGHHGRSSMTNCHVFGTLSIHRMSDGAIGLFAGTNGGHGTIRRCSAQGQLTILPSDYDVYSVGGLLGVNYGHISQCFADVDINIQDYCMYVGGLCGTNGNSIDNSYAFGSMTCGLTETTFSDYIGGLVGENYSDLTNCYAATTMSLGEYTDAVGALCGYNCAAINACFWDTQVSTLTDGVGSEDPDPCSVTGLPSADLWNQTTYTTAPADWDFTDTDGNPAIWKIRDTHDWPLLTWQETLPGDIAGSYNVDLADFAALNHAYLANLGDPHWNHNADLDDSTDINITDLAILAQNWLTTLH